MRLYKADTRRKFEDARGIIDNLTPDGMHFQHVARITGVADAVRGNHYHKEDEHYCYVDFGVISYEYMEPSSTELKKVLLTEGDVVYTPAGEKHRFTFRSNGVFYSFSKLPRDHDTYEKETVREEF